LAINDSAKAVAAAPSLPSSVDEVHLFDALVGQLGRALIRVTVDDMDAEINLWLKRIGTGLELDRSTIAQIDPVTGFANVTHGWAREPYRLISQRLDAKKLLPWTVERILAGETVAMSNPDQLPKEAAVDRKSFLRYGPKSNVVVPISVSGTVVGGMSFASLRRERSWPAYTLQGFEAIGEIFGLGLERKLKHVSRMNMMAELAASMVHELNQPLGAILSNAEAVEVMLASEQLDLDEIRAGIADIIDDNNRARDTIQRIWALFPQAKLAIQK
jgi:signal transduction histidine kinase